MLIVKSILFELERRWNAEFRSWEISLKEFIYKKNQLRIIRELLQLFLRAICLTIISGKAQTFLNSLDLKISREK